MVCLDWLDYKTEVNSCEERDWLDMMEAMI